MGNIGKTFVTFLIYCHFLLDPAPGRTDAHILALNGSNDLFPPKDGPFGGQDDEWRHMEKIGPKNSPIRGANRQFQAKIPKSRYIRKY